ncbi:MAG: cell surface protein SprA [Flavobacteriales bacterium]|nr:cell surface protein SprA [Flavobacteriales bacterium]
MKYVGLLLLFCLTFGSVWAQNDPDTNLIWPLNPTYDPTQTSEQSFDLGDPNSVERTIVYDPVTGKYIFKEVIGESGLNYRNPSMMTLEEYIEYERQKALADNWKEKIDEQTAENQPFEFPIKVGNKVFENFFGSDQITIRTTGSVEISLGVNSSRYDNPILPVRQRRITRFDFQQQINLNLVGQIGTRVKLGTSYNTQAAFDFDNISTLEYTGDEDQIIQKIQLGNVAFQPPTSLIQGSQTLFGAYGQLKFGNTTVDLIGASSRGQKKEINIQGGAQAQQFEVTADNYETNRHYFLNMYHHDHYDEGMSTLPIPNTTINLTRIEVWVMNRTNETENTRNIIAFADLGEAKQENCQGDPGGYSASELPDNNANDLYDWAANQPLVRGFNNSVQALGSQFAAPGPFQQAVHYEKVENARKLNDSEFSYSAQLGFVSLNMPLNNDEVLAVAYEYTYRGETYQVGEFSTDGISGQEALMVKLLKPTITNPKNAVWDLMMKNVYSIGAYQVDQEGFRLNILYNNPLTSVNVPFLPVSDLVGGNPPFQSNLDDKQLVTVLEMDRLNQNNQLFSDGVFDFVPIDFNGNRAESAGTINRRNGRIYFSTVEPFGKTLADKLLGDGVPSTIVDQYAYTELYDSTKTAAQQIPAKNRFSFFGEYKSSISSDIPLNALNVPEGAVTVTAGGILLTEGQDYTVDYNLGRVKILNEAYLSSNTPIKISIESNSVFGFQSKSLLGSRVAHRFSDKLNVGATWMRMMERPVTQKVDIGSEPYKNNIIGFDLQYRTDVPLLTKLVDLLPVISTKERSTFSFKGEFAHLIPGSPRAINKEGTSYIDDFEGAQSAIDLRSATAWHLASVPKGQPDLFPEANNLDLSAGFKRGRSSWYVVDPLFAQGTNITPQHIKDDPTLISDSRVRLVSQTEIWPNQQLALGTIGNIPILDLAYYPKERGMYNYDTTSVDQDGLFTDPQNRWAGIMRALTTNDFELTNIEYIQFWMLDPFNEDAEAVDPTSNHSGGDMYFNLGNISEDVLPDSRRSFENGLPPFDNSSQDNVDETTWARISTLQQTVNAFDNDPAARVNQDVGYDGWSNAEERLFYSSYVNWVQNSTTLSAAAKARMLADPSSDDYRYYRDDVYDQLEANILERYKKFRGLEGNSPTIEMSDTMNAEGYPTQATNQPDMEEFNNNNTLDETESYFQYRVSLRPNDLQEGQNYITNIQTVKNGTKTERWLQFKVPIRDFEKRVNGIQDFRTIRFMRIFLKDFNEEVVVRFARLEFIRGEWRQYLETLVEPGEGVTTDPNLTTFNIGAVNVEENDQREPIKYEIPPGISREIDPSQTFQRQLNEQSLTLEVCNLQDGDARAAYKNVQFDVRTYKKLKMFAHAERVKDQSALNDDDLTLFVRMGTDFVDNYYEYEMPLKLTDFGAKLPEDIWPEENNVEITFQDFLNLKKSRNEAGISNLIEYTTIDPANSTRVLKVKGSPNLQGMKTIMIGIRNPHINKDTPWQDDGLAKCVNAWINELRLTDFVSEGGSAATAQMQVQFADFANLNMSANYSGINWGSVDSRVQERQRNQQMNFDMNTTVQLGQFFGKKARVQLPLFYSYSIGVVNPEFDPFNPDIRLSDYDDANLRRERAKLGQDYTERRAYNFTNVRKELKAGADNHFWRISNWALSYAYSEDLHRDFNTNYDRTKRWTSSLNYNYSFKAKPIMPFKKVKFMQKSKWWAIVRDMNFYLTPKNVSFGTDVMRNYNERQVRNNLIPAGSDPDDFRIAPVYLKQFNWNRTYALAYDITKKLKFTFDANSRSMFEEGDGAVEQSSFRDTIGSQLMTFGRAMDYSHNFTFKYTLPLNQFPATDWISANATWKGSYNWQRGPLAQPDFGNVIQNSRDINMTAQLNFTSLYNKVKFFKKVNNDGRNPRGRASARDRNGDRRGGSKKKPEAEEEEDPNLTEKQKERKKRREERKKLREEREKARGGKVHPVAGFLARALMTVRNVNGTYSITDGTLLPGYNQRAGVLGFDPGNKAGIGGFVFGQQQFNVWGQETGYNIASRLASNNLNDTYIVHNANLNQQYTITHNENINLRATLEPFKDVSIELTANRVYSRNSSEFYRFNDSTSAFESQSKVEIATLTYSNVSIGSAFAMLGKEYQSSVFQNLLDNRQAVSELLGQENGNSNLLTSGYYDGYSRTQQEVVLGAFLTSYTNRGINEKNINPVRNLPLPNWSINYNGLKNFKFMKDVLKNFVMRHGYSSSVSVSGIQTNLNAEFDANGDATARDLNSNFIAQNQIQNVTVTERFSPLIGLDATWNIKDQGLITKFEFKKDRSAALSLNNNQVTEILGSEWVIGTGYKFSKVKLPIEKVPASPVNVRVDISFRDNLTVIRNIDENSNQATAGQRVISIKSSADYNLSKYLVVQFYYDHTLNTPKIATSYPTGNMSTGLRLRFNLAGVQ